MEHNIPKLITPGVIYSSPENFYIYPSLAAAKKGLMVSSNIEDNQAKFLMSQRLGVLVDVAPKGTAFRCLETQNYIRSISAAKVRFLDEKIDLDECWILYRDYTQFEDCDTKEEVDW